MPPLHLIPVLLIAVPGLLRLIDGSRGPARAARLGWWFGFGHHVLGLYWITEAILIEAARYWWFVPIAVPSLAAILAAFIAAAVALARLARPGLPRLLVLAGAWTLADIAREFAFSGFPWNPWGSVWAIPGALGDVLIQPAAWIGEPGLTALTVLLAGLPALGVGGRARWAPLAAGGAVLAGWIAFGLIRLGLPAPSAPGLSVLLVQGNIAQGQKWDREMMEDIFRHYLTLTAEAVRAAGPGPKVVVWPETASPFLLEADEGAREAVTAASSEAPVLAGTVRFDANQRPRNSLAALAAGGALRGIYDKWHLVPFGEFQPAWLPIPIQVVPGGGFAPGPGPRTLHVPGLPPVGPMICYEAVYTGELVDRTDRPAWLVNITNDAWFGNSTGPRQHLVAARFRAVEEGLPLMRAANTGITAGFDAHGRELGRLDMARPGTLALALPGALPPTPYARFGLLIPGLLATAAVIVGFLASPRRRAA